MTYACQHSIPIRLSTCLGNFTEFNQKKHEVKPRCHSRAQLALHSQYPCGPCQRADPEAQCVARLEALRLADREAGAEERSPGLVAAEIEGPDELYRLTRRYPGKESRLVERRWRPEQGRPAPQERRRGSLLKVEVMREDVVGRGGQGGDGWGDDWGSGYPTLDEELEEQEADEADEVEAYGAMMERELRAWAEDTPFGGTDLPTFDFDAGPETPLSPPPAAENVDPRAPGVSEARRPWDEISNDRRGARGPRDEKKIAMPHDPAADAAAPGRARAHIRRFHAETPGNAPYASRANHQPSIITTPPTSSPEEAVPTPPGIAVAEPGIAIYPSTMTAIAVRGEKPRRALLRPAGLAHDTLVGQKTPAHRAPAPPAGAEAAPRSGLLLARDDVEFAAQPLRIGDGAGEGGQEGGEVDVLPLLGAGGVDAGGRGCWGWGGGVG
ncbi:hypothetical protein LTR53_016763 [Teratosphaeriaceae sp. CCFEE 6253]|nr:hypothetical protein LTR53_016763 [Teratosphaeriaceae sp. CCFEE 6253]